jgi:two-component system, cell cycle sensor histidine kinase and response regulator CckA
MTTSRRSEPGTVALDVLDSLMEGCQVISRDWKYLFLNPALLQQVNRRADELLGRTMMECFPGIEQTPMFAELRRCMEARTTHRMLNRFAMPSGGERWFELHIVPVPDGLCVLSIDVTEYKETQLALSNTEEQLRHAQKMEAVGRLAGGVAHDFNNILTVVLSYSSLALEGLPDGDPVAADLREIQRAAERGAGLTRQLLAFSRRQVVEPVTLNLNDVISRSRGMLRPLLGEDLVLRVVLDPELDDILADPGHMEQVLMNLVVNARDAMPHGGTLTIETANVDLDDNYAGGHLGTHAGPYVLLAVSDTGVGMDKETQTRIFEPFFTTKPAGRGTGLGLSTVFGIVQQCGGALQVYSEPGSGATFKAYFPRASNSWRPAPAREVTEPRSGSETILVADDDEQVRTVTGELLRRRGYHVLHAATPADAMRLAGEHEGPIHLLMSDVIMPGMSGPELAHHVLALRPGIKVVLMSGYTGEALAQLEMLDQHPAFLQKPITPRLLDAVLNKVFAPEPDAV